MRAKELLPVARLWGPLHLWEPVVAGRASVRCADCGLTVAFGGKGGRCIRLSEGGRRVESPVVLSTQGDLQWARVPERNCEVLEYE